MKSLFVLVVVSVSLSVLLLCLIAPSSASEQSPKLAVLIASAQESRSAELHDLSAMYNALLQRGFSRHEIMILKGRLSVKAVKEFLSQAHHRIAAWSTGQVFIYYSGHGWVEPATMEPALWLSRDPDEKLSWREFFAVLAAPASVAMLILPDC